MGKEPFDYAVDAATGINDGLAWLLAVRADLASQAAIGAADRPAVAARLIRAAEAAAPHITDINVIPHEAVVPAAGDHHGAGRRRATLLGRAVDAILGTHRQWQRLAPTRAFFPDAPLMVLDEPTAALDAKGEHELFARIGELFADRSVLVSHRFCTVRSVDPIYVLNQGYVVESGTHEKLLAAGDCAELFTLPASRTSSASPVRARLE